MQADHLQKPVRTLRKSLKRLPGDPAPSQVHKLRIRARQMETLVAALTSEDGRRTKRLLKTMKPLRKAAGGVRDVDVMTENALKLAEPAGRDSLARLVTHLGTRRQQSAAELVDAAERKRKAARRRLKRFAKRMESALKADTGERSVKLKGSIRAAAEKLHGELSRWPALVEANIHRFRLKVKELRSLLQLERSRGSGLVRALGDAKDKIGDWHDWQQLREIAREILDAHEDRELLTEIDGAVKRKLKKALMAANALRRRYLRAPKMF